ncbi:MAG: hypothetical protein JW783_01155 [Bacteroidales bacterium]|nr:hypothetical protein [Bacteroidales bacterium]MBN2749611.1 hypothetical protein [Bacteroidales bacterium]
MKAAVKRSYILLGVLMLSAELSGFCALGDPPKSRSKAMMDRLGKSHEIILKNDTLLIKPQWFVPTHYRAQMAGSIGFFSVGAGYQLKYGYQPTLMYGFLNKTFGHSSVTVHTVSLKNAFVIGKKPLFGYVYPRVGISVNWGKTNNTFDKLPPHYPQKYYFQNKVHLSPFWGGEILVPTGKDRRIRVGCYFEFSTLDAYILECVRTSYVTIWDIWSLGFGISVFL